MTWRKTGTEFDDECALADLSNGAYRTHQEAIGYIYNVELMTCRFPKRSLPRFAASPSLADDIRELVGAGFWKDATTDYEVIHHADVIRQSLAAQQGKRVRDKKAQRTHRAKQADPEYTTEGTPFVSADVSADVSVDTDRQTDRHLGGRVQGTCAHGIKTQFWKCPECHAQEATA